LADERYLAGSPVTKEKPSIAKVSQATDWAPDALRQETQWQIADIRGLSDTLYRTLPHKHPPSLTFSLLIDGFSQDVARTARYRLPDYSPKCLEGVFSEARKL
jgi:hypothetical protein